MQSSFEVLEWESASKEQDSLVRNLFGDISLTNITSSAVLSSDWSSKNEVNASKRRKRKVLENDDNTGKLKRKRKKKRENNKFKQGQKFSSEHQENKVTNKTSDGTNAFEEGDDTIAATVEYEETALVQKYGEKLNGFNNKKEKKKKIINQNEEGDISENKKKNKIKTNSVNQYFKNTDPATPADVEIEETASKQETTEGSNVSKSKKEKKKKRREKKKVDDKRDMSELRERTTETNQNHKRKNKTHKGGQDKYSSFEEPVTEHEPKLQDTNKSILNPSVPQRKTSLHEKMTKQLESSRFRWINEQLYTTTGEEAAVMFSEDPSLFDIYHRGFTNQIRLWPVNPVDKIIEWLKKRPTSHVVADFGCGEAAIAQGVSNKVYSFDLVAKNKFVTACDMAKVPLSSASVDVAVFCLSLMGTNLVDFLREAHRVLKPGGNLKVAEVASRINDTAEFVKCLSRLGFKLQNEDTTNKMFVLFDFMKVKDTDKSVPSSKLEGLNLKPCIYKKR